MNSYEINMIFSSEQEAVEIFRRIESTKKSKIDYLEDMIANVFDVKLSASTKEFNVEMFKISTNEISIYCYGSKFPSLSISELFKDISIPCEYGIKLRATFDDGGKEYYYDVNSASCSAQKYSAFYRNTKIQDAKASKKKKATKTAAKLARKKKPIDLEEKAKQDQLLQDMDYGKDRTSKTALVRLLVRSKPKKEVIYNQFKQAIELKDEKDLSDFINRIGELFNSGSPPIIWTNDSYKDGVKQFQAPEGLMYGLKFVISQDNYIYLGFDVEQLELHDSRAIANALENMVLIFDSIDGVNKTWIKYRSGKNTKKERFILYPDSGREPYALLRDITDDYKWSL